MGDSSKEEGFFCFTSWHNSELWEYCAPPGKTRYNVPCVSECAQKGKDYWWCYTTNPGSTWEYCSPSSQLSVKKLTHTVNGQECVGDCGTHGEKYWWCKKPQRWPPKSGKGGSNGDSTWDYCSPDFHTRYNKPCKDACESRGEDYFWCHTTDNSWDYCSPKAVEPVIARGGRPCVGICGMRAAAAAAGGTIVGKGLRQPGRAGSQPL